jgi:1-acyl-sn-glycerol-3-phosphate acyltransferase
MENGSGNSKKSGEFLRPLNQRIVYRVLRRIAQVGFLVLFGIRVFGRENFPKSGSALVCANHQSHLDPMMAGVGCNRRMNYLGRKTLFKVKLFAWLINFLDAIPLDKSGMGIAGIRETMKRLKRGELVLIFPEGTRSHDGEIGKINPGFAVLARRTKTRLLPVGIDGTFDVWPRTKNFPSPSRIAVSIGPAIEFEDYQDLSDDELVELLGARIATELERARKCIKS